MLRCAGGAQAPRWALFYVFGGLLNDFVGVFQLCSEVEEGCRQHASASGITLPATFSISRIFEEMAAKGTINTPLLQAARVLRRNGGCQGGFGVWGDGVGVLVPS